MTKTVGTTKAGKAGADLPTPVGRQGGCPVVRTPPVLLWVVSAGGWPGGCPPSPITQRYRR